MPSMESDHNATLRLNWSDMSETEKQEFTYEFQRLIREEPWGALQLMPLPNDGAKMQATIDDLTAKLEKYRKFAEWVRDCGFGDLMENAYYRAVEIVGKGDEDA
ncbi:MAG: hypothetical protein M0Z85_08120 [Gammaproteobacteria bacterium]|nr:hypothetical protein [Gammaproteobacteria bacterium]